MTLEQLAQFEARQEVRRAEPIRFVHDDGGRSCSRRPKQRNDCAVRALAIVCGVPYDQVYDEMKAAGRQSGRGTPNSAFQRWLDARGAVRLSFPAAKGQERMYLARFAREYPSGRYVVRTAGHLSAVVDGAVYGMGPPDGARCVYVVWRLG